MAKKKVEKDAEENGNRLNKGLDKGAKTSSKTEQKGAVETEQMASDGVADNELEKRVQTLEEGLGNLETVTAEIRDANGTNAPLKGEDVANVADEPEPLAPLLEKYKVKDEWKEKLNPSGSFLDIPRLLNGVPQVPSNGRMNNVNIRKVYYGSLTDNDVETYLKARGRLPLTIEEA